jgi:hypothetical protein
VADLVHTLDVEKGEEWEKTWIRQHLVNLADVVHALVEQERFVVVAEDGVSVGGGEEDDHGINEFKAVEKGKVVRRVRGTFLMPLLTLGAERPYLDQWLR